jgi:small-conductance mechanosensitive channel
MADKTGYSIMQDGTKFKITKSDNKGTCVTETTDDNNYIKSFVDTALSEKKTVTTEKVKSDENTTADSAEGTTTTNSAEGTAAATAAATAATAAANKVQAAIATKTEETINDAQTAIDNAEKLINKLPQDDESTKKLLEELENEKRILENVKPKIGGKSKKNNRTKKLKKGGKKKKSQKHKSKKC